MSKQKSLIEVLCNRKHTSLEEQIYDFDEKAESVARDRGQVVVYPRAHELQIDLDSQEAYQDFLVRFEKLVQAIESWKNYAFAMKESFSKSGKPNRHISILIHSRETGDLTPLILTEWQRIALQQALGSDPVREYLNALRCLAGNERATRLFENPAPAIPEITEGEHFNLRHRD